MDNFCGPCDKDCNYQTKRFCVGRAFCQNAEIDGVKVDMVPLGHVVQETKIFYFNREFERKKPSETTFENL